MAYTDFLKDANYINGEWIAADGAEIVVSNPSTGDRLGAVPRFGRAHTAQAIDAANAAQPGWRALSAGQRAGYLEKLADLIDQHTNDLAELLTLEMGKPLAEAKGEVGLGAKYLRWFAAEGQRVYGDTIPSPWPDRRIMVTKEPVGVVAAITPWNFPSLMLGRKLAAAWAAGCTTVCKPASATPYSALAFGVLADMAGFPKGVLNIVTGSAREIADEMTENPLVKKITFTGSTEVGKELAAKASAHMKKISMELGGNAPFIVFDDADLDAAVDGAMACKFRNAGQTCVCANRIYVQAGVYDAFAEKFAAAVAAMPVGDGMTPGVQQGPLIDLAAVEKVESHVADAVAKGATLITGGQRHANGGSFFQPTVASGATPDMLVAQDETFGPFAPLFKFGTEDDAVRMANDTPFGLASYFYTSNLGRAFRVTEALEYGLVGVNAGVITTEVAPFGGIKDSGFGREGSKYGLDDYMSIKYACFGELGV